VGKRSPVSDGADSVGGVIYQRPLAYLLGLEGVALLRGYAGDYDRAFVEARIAEVRRLLDDPTLAGEGVTAFRAGTTDGYRFWAATYDEPGNGIFEYEEPFVHEIIDALPAGVALDAACGTGRHSAYLAARGHDVIGVDGSPEMLARARTRVPQGDFRLGDLHALPVPDDHVDLITCALALTHVPDLAPVFAEFARVLRPGGHLVISDVHHELVALGSVPRLRSATGEPGLMPAHRHRAADYLHAALPQGLTVRGCDEPRHRIPDPGDAPAAKSDTGPWDQWPWSLHALAPAAQAAAWSGLPATIIWHFQLSEAHDRP
jgi:SAM-dependent methyltransferase